MIIPITGKVTYAITLDPTVWIFDDRKIMLEEAFVEKQPDETEDDLERAANRWNQEIYQQKIKPPVNKSISKFEREKILKHSFVMPITDFIGHAEMHSDAKDATLVTNNGDCQLSLEELQNSYLLFARNGKPLQEDGPVHLFFKNGSNKDNPIRGIKKIIIN